MIAIALQIILVIALLIPVYSAAIVIFMVWFAWKLIQIGAFHFMRRAPLLALVVLAACANPTPAERDAMSVLEDAGEIAGAAYMLAHPMNASLPLPTGASSIADTVSYVFQAYFGRSPLAPGLAYWSNYGLGYLAWQIVANAGPADKQFMSDNETV